MQTQETSGWPHRVVQREPGRLVFGARWPGFAARWMVLALVWCCGPNPLDAQQAPLQTDMRVFERQARTLFDPSLVTRSDSELATSCDRVLLMFQAISLALVAGGMIAKLRRDHEQMEGFAAMMLKVAFVATIPFWRTFTIETADAVANAIGYQSVSNADAASPLMTRMWDLLNQWVMPGSPSLDALQSQSADNLPASGTEQNWSLQAWNWARGVTATGSTQFDALWPAITGSARAFWIHTCCACMACLVVVSIIMTYFMQVVRYLLLYAGCAFLPVFIAGLGIDMLRSQSIKYVLGVVSVACWPIGWAMTNIVTIAIVQGATGWMTRLSATALGMNPGAASVPPIAVAAPNLAWGAILLFVGLTLVICLWCFVALFFVPLLMGKAIGSGAQMLSGVWMPGGYSGAASTTQRHSTALSSMGSQSESAPFARVTARRPASPAGDTVPGSHHLGGSVAMHRFRTQALATGAASVSMVTTMRHSSDFQGSSGRTPVMQEMGSTAPKPDAAPTSRGSALVWLPKPTRLGTR